VVREWLRFFRPGFAGHVRVLFAFEMVPVFLSDFLALGARPWPWSTQLILPASRSLAGACYEQNSTTISLGNSNSQLRFNQTGSLYLLYEDGAECSTDSGIRRWSTKIEFVCANNATKDNGANSAGTAGGGDSFKIIEDSNCQLLIQYQTPLACREPIKCKASVYVDHTTDGLGSSGDELIDLTPLISASDNYEAKVELPASLEHLVPKTTKVSPCIP